MLEQQVLPIARMVPAEQLQRVKSDIVMCRAAAMRDNNELEQIHGQPPGGLSGSASPRVICALHKCHSCGDAGRPMVNVFLRIGL